MKTALITGGTSSLGLAAAKIFFAHDFNCVLVGRSRERFDNIKATLNGNCEFISAELAGFSEATT